MHVFRVVWMWCLLYVAAVELGQHSALPLCFALHQPFKNQHTSNLLYNLAELHLLLYLWPSITTLSTWMRL